MYPNTGFNAGHGANSTASLSGSQVSGTVPAGQTVYRKGTSGTVYDPNMALGYLVCKKTVAASSTERTVDLPFRPATTTFQFKFKLRAGDDAVTVSKFEMVSTAPIAGGFKFDMASGADADKHNQASWGDVTTSSTSNTITVTFDNAPTLSSSSALDFTVFALPLPIFLNTHRS